MSKEFRRVTTQFIERNFEDLCNAINRKRQEEQGEEYKKLSLRVSTGAWNPTVERLADLEEMFVHSIPMENERDYY